MGSRKGTYPMPIPRWVLIPEPITILESIPILEPIPEPIPEFTPEPIPESFPETTPNLESIPNSEPICQETVLESIFLCVSS